MKSFISIILLLTLISASAQSSVVVNVPPGDLDALRLAMDEANAGDPSVETIINTSGTFVFRNTIRLPDVHAQIHIRGHYDPITFHVVQDDLLSQIVLIEEDGRLKLENIEFTGTTTKNEQGSGPSLITNEGVLELSQVQMNELLLPSFHGGTFGTFRWTHPIIVNTQSGQLLLNRVSLINSGNSHCGIYCAGGLINNEGEAHLQNTQIYYSHDNWAPPLRNSGYMSLTNVSIYFSNSDGLFGTYPIVMQGNAETLVANSIFSGFSGLWCEDAQSTGHNFVDHNECNFAAEGDFVGGSAGLIWRPIVDRSLVYDWHADSKNPETSHILTHALVPMATSRVVDSIDVKLCSRGDLVSQFRDRDADGNGDGVAKCDKGAFELQPIHLEDGGINGVYFNPDADGHYVSIIDNPYNTLIMWNSFDQDGNQYFVNGTGELMQGRSLIADAYINVEGSTSSEGKITPAQELHWGTLEIDMTSCNEGTLTFNSEFPKIGSGQVRLERLVFVKQLGCVD